MANPSTAPDEMPLPHPLLGLLLDAADGRFPPVDGGVTILPPLPDGNRAVVAFTGHAVIASPLSSEDLAGLGADGFGGAVDPAVLLRVADGGAIGVHDATLVADGVNGADGAPVDGDHVRLEPTDRYDAHPRVAHARRLRRGVEVFGDEADPGAGFVTIAIGLAGRREMSIELLEPGRRPGAGRRLIAAARRHVPAGSPLFAAVSPGNARSLRAFLAEGFRPVGSEVIIDMGGDRRA